MKIKSTCIAIVLTLFLFCGFLQAQDTFSISSGNFSLSYLAENAFDGDETTRWVSKENEPTAWVLYDFQKSISFRNIIINWENSYAKDYSIQSSENGKDWKTIHQEKNGKGGLITLNELEFSGLFFTQFFVTKPDLELSICP